ncbi:MAG TPA: hypothetical protein PLP08_11810 [Plasticicumulans sp.]|uniref:helix-turn-helix transcriptional regulator n=1 Tax=Plasticicumulans sp. TaxID=2307179 RepID=UPI000FA643CA|nr:hypothetical protein [Plasticicumulans sp.]MBS0603196.1 hypothetical protein [Pseudomonadota bacterium]RTK99131.1 MAG: hypothetical protein EKK65_09935 [Xanthomonadales bacterium]HNF66318.1 hypothetical protein [Plasticicumulans sp.]HNG50272.1 hypothetical protein [Plasticicumulans sp.]HNJ08221.1 hypothetical protein [Plasticicumulans sp.]
MYRLTKLQRMHELFCARRTPITIDGLMQELGCSRATVLQLTELLRDRMGAPLEHEGAEYHYRRPEADDYTLPAMWLNAAELDTVLQLQALLGPIPPGPLAQALEPLRRRVARLVDLQPGVSGSAWRRIRVSEPGARRVQPAHMAAIAQAVLSRLRLRLEGEFIAGEYSPQYLFHCRGRWLLDAWHHGAEARRTIALEEIAAAGLLDKPAVDIEEDEPPFACLF